MKTDIRKNDLFVLVAILAVAITFTFCLGQPVHAEDRNTYERPWSLYDFQWPEERQAVEIENGSPYYPLFPLPDDRLMGQNDNGKIEGFVNRFWDFSFDMVYPSALGNWLEDLMEGWRDFRGYPWGFWRPNYNWSTLNWPGFGFPGKFFLNLQPGFTVGQTFEASIPIDSHTRLILEGVNGEMVIRGQNDRNSIAVIAYLTVGSDSEVDAKMHMDDLDILVTDDSDGILIETVQPENIEGRSYKVEYDIIVPSEFEVMSSQDNGRISIYNIENNIDVWNGNGSILFSDITGDITAGVENGNIKGVMLQPYDKKMDMFTTNGSIELRISSIFTSAELFTTVVNGDIRVSNLDISEVVKGDKELNGVIGDGEGTIELNTVNGNITVIGFN